MPASQDYYVTDLITGDHGRVLASDITYYQSKPNEYSIVYYTGQDGGATDNQLGYNPLSQQYQQKFNNQITFWNAQDARYETISRSAYDMLTAQNQAYANDTQRAQTMGDIIAKSRGPDNAFQYSNALAGAPNASGSVLFDRLATGNLGSTVSPTANNLHPLDIQKQLMSLFQNNASGGGSGGGGSQQAAQTGAQGGGQAASTASGASSSTPTTVGGMTYGNTPTGGSIVTNRNLPGDPAQAAAPYKFQTGMGNTAGPATIAMGDPRTWTPTTSTAPLNAAGKVDTSQYARTTASNKGSSDIAHVNKSHNLIESYGYGHGSDARNAAHKAAGMSGEEFDRIVKHGGDPFKKSQATGGFSVVDHPQTVHVGEDNKPEAMMVWPLDRPGTPVPPAIRSLANAVGPDHTMRMAAGGGVAALPPDPSTAAPPMSGPPRGWGAPPADPLAGGATPPASAGGFDPSNPNQPPQALAAIAALLATPPTPTDGPTTQAVRANWTLGQDGQPQFIGQPAQAGAPQPRPDGSVGMATGGGIIYGGPGAAVGSAPTYKSAIGKVNSAGQVKVPDARKGAKNSKGSKTVPIAQVTPLPNFTNLPPALQKGISPSGWQLIGSKYGAAGGDAQDIPYLLQQGLPTLSRAPRVVGSGVF